MTQVIVRSATPGRVRWEIGDLLDRPRLAWSIEHALTPLAGVRSVSANPITARVLLLYDAGGDPSRVVDLCRLTLERVLSGDLPDWRESSGAPARTPAAEPLRQLLDLTRRERPQALLTLVLSFVDRLFEAAPPAMIGAAMDIVARGEGSIFAALGFTTIPTQLAALGVACAIVWTLDAASGYVRRLSAARLSLAVQTDLRNQLYTHLQRLDVGQLERRPTSEWLSLLQSDVDRIGDFIETGIDPIVTILTNVFIVTTTFLVNAPGLLAIQLTALPGLYFVSTLMLDPIRRRQDAAQARDRRLAGALQTNVFGLPTIAAFGRQEGEAARIEALGEAVRASGNQATTLTSAYVPAIQMVVGAGFISTLVRGGVLVDRGELSIASFNLMGFSSLRLLVALGSLGVALERYQRTSLSIGRVGEFLDLRPRVVSGTRRLPAPVGGELECRHVWFEYEPGRPVLRDVTLRVPARRTTGIVGPSGAGKTTILKLLLRFYDATRGTVTFDGEDIQSLRLDELRATMAVMAQQVFLFDGTVRDNVAYARPDATADEIQAALRFAQADGFVSELPLGVDTPIGEGGSALSMGQRQRLAIARAILANRPILLFDEATSAIDYETESAIQAGLRDLQDSRTIVIVAHRLSTVRHADRIYVLDEGQVREEGTHEELVAANGLYAGLWRIQTGEPPPDRIVQPEAAPAPDAPPARRARPPRRTPSRRRKP